MPEITSLDGGILVTLYNDLLVNQGGQISGQISGQIGDQIFTERQIEIYNLILENNRITRKELAEQLGIAESAIQKHIKTLTNAKVVSRVGTRNGYWKIEN